MSLAQASGDAEFELTQGLLSELGDAEDGDLEAGSLDDDEEQQGIPLADEATKNEVRSAVSLCRKHSLRGKIPGSHTASSRPFAATQAYALCLSTKRCNAEREILGYRAYLQQLVDGKLDNQLPMQGRGSATQQEYNAELEKFMSTFKMQACLSIQIPWSHDQDYRDRALQRITKGMRAIADTWLTRQSAEGRTVKIENEITVMH